MGISYSVVQTNFCYYAVLISNSILRHRQTERQADDIMMAIADHPTWE